MRPHLPALLVVLLLTLPAVAPAAQAATRAGVVTRDPVGDTRGGQGSDLGRLGDVTRTTLVRVGGTVRVRTAFADLERRPGLRQQVIWVGQLRGARDGEELWVEQTVRGGQGRSTRVGLRSELRDTTEYRCRGRVGTRIDGDAVESSFPRSCLPAGALDLTHVRVVAQLDRRDGPDRATVRDRVQVGRADLR